MKKILVLLLTVMLTFGLCACSSPNASGGSAVADATGTSTTTSYTYEDVTFEIPTAWGEPVESEGSDNTYYFYPEGRDTDSVPSMLMISITDEDSSLDISETNAEVYFNIYNSGLTEEGINVESNRVVKSFRYPCEYVTATQTVDNSTYNEAIYVVLYNEKIYGIMMATLDSNKNDYSSDLTNIMNSLEYGGAVEDDSDESVSVEDYDYDYDDDYEESTTTTTEANISSEYLAALNQAESYSESMHMSKQGIYDQLISEYGGKFDANAAQYAIDNVDADWNENALETAKSYRESMSMSSSEIHDQLTSDYGEKFTEEQADYAIKHLDD